MCFAFDHFMVYIYVADLGRLFVEGQCKFRIYLSSLQTHICSSELRSLFSSRKRSELRSEIAIGMGNDKVCLQTKEYKSWFNLHDTIFLFQLFDLQIPHNLSTGARFGSM